MGRSLLNEHTKDQDRFIRSKFNGTIVMNITGLQKDEELRKFIVHLRRTVFTTLDLFVKSQEEIDRLIDRTFQSWSQL